MHRRTNIRIKKDKGITLIETIVSIALFSFISLALVTSVISMKRVLVRQEENVRLEMICYDISEYYSCYSDNWYKKYFGENYNNGQVGYLTEDFKITANFDEAKYIIEFK